MKVISTDVTHDGTCDDGNACWVLQLHAAVNCEEDKERATEFLHQSIHIALEQTEEVIRQTVEFMKQGKADERLFIELVGAMTHPADGEKDDVHLNASLYAAVVMALSRQRVDEEAE